MTALIWEVLPPLHITTDLLYRQGPAVGLNKSCCSSLVSLVLFTKLPLTRSFFDCSNFCLPFFCVSFFLPLAEYWFNWGCCRAWTSQKDLLFFLIKIVPLGIKPHHAFKVLLIRVLPILPFTQSPWIKQPCLHALHSFIIYIHYESLSAGASCLCKWGVYLIKRLASAGRFVCEDGSHVTSSNMQF